MCTVQLKVMGPVGFADHGAIELGEEELTVELDRTGYFSS